MSTLNMLNQKGQSAGTIELKDDIFNVEINEHVLHMSVVAYLANQRQGTQSAKTRAEVSGGGIKPRPQKGSGRSRQGSIRSPQWVGGGVAFAPKPREFRLKLNKKVKKLAMKCALSSKLADNNIIVVDEIKLDGVKTKAMNEIFKNIKVGRGLLVLAEPNDNIYLSARNIEGFLTATVNTISPYEILKYDNLILTKAAVEKIGEVYA